MAEQDAGHGKFALSFDFTRNKFQFAPKSGHDRFMNPELKRGERIVVYDRDRVELGEGTFQEREIHGATTAYVCAEHTILAQGPHYIKLRGEWHQIDAR
ncbi:MAG TPA: hypothetical protein PKC28_13480 [Bdellovibrionales bacterium]|nr:hypothetical protein [Bdellovibrionales bacterium]